MKHNTSGDGICEECGVNHNDLLRKVASELFGAEGVDELMAMAEREKKAGFQLALEIVADAFLGRNPAPQLDRAVSRTTLAGAVIFSLTEMIIDTMQTIGPDDSPMELLKRWQDLQEMNKEARKQ